MPAKLRRAKGIYAYAEGLHTVMHYPQYFLVTLKGEPALRNDFSTAPSMTTGHTGAAAAVNSTLRFVMDPQTNQRSHCNHRGCIYNQGDLLTRRNRFRLAAAELDARLQQQHEQHHDVHVVTKKVSSEVILDTGAGRHLHNNLSDFTNLRTCVPQTLSGFMGGSVTVTKCGTVGRFTDVLYLPTSAANVRSVAYALKQRGGTIQFEESQAIYQSKTVKPTVIAHKNAAGLYIVIPNTIPEVSRRNYTPIYISIPVQVRREAIHRLHQCLGHASVACMRCAQELPTNMWIARNKRSSFVYRLSCVSHGKITKSSKAQDCEY